MFFRTGLFHKLWFADQQPYVHQVEMVQPSQPHLAVVGSTIHRPMPTPTGEVPKVDVLAIIDVDRMAAAMEASRGRLFNNLMAIAKRIITGAVEAGPEKCKQVQHGLHALAASVTAAPPLQSANPPPVQSGPLVPYLPHKPKGKGRKLPRSPRLQPRHVLLRRLILDLLRAQLPLPWPQQWAMWHFPSRTCRSCHWHR